MKELLVFVANREADADDVRRVLREANAGSVSLVGPDFAILDAEAGQWQPTQPGHRLRNLPWTLASLVLAGVLTGAAWTGFALGVVSGALARRVRTGWRAAPTVDLAEVLQSAVFVVADQQDVDGVTGRLAHFEGRVLRVPLPAEEEGAAGSAQDGNMLDEEPDAERRKRLQSENLASVRAFSAEDRLGRDDIHDRNALS